MISLLYSPTTRIEQYIAAFPEFKTRLILCDDTKDKNEILILPEAADINPNLRGFFHKFRIPPYTGPIIDAYIDHFFSYSVDSAVDNYKKIIAVGASAAYFHNSLGRRLTFQDERVFLLMNGIRATKYRTEKYYINLAPLNECLAEVKSFINGDDNGKAITGRIPTTPRPQGSARN